MAEEDSTQLPPATVATNKKIQAVAVFHIVAIPTFLGVHFYLHPERLQHPSYAGLAILAFIYIFTFRRIVLPNLFGPLRHVPTERSSRLIFGHIKFTYPRVAGPSMERLVNSVPNNGLIHHKGFFYMDSRLTITSAEALFEVLSTRSYDYEKPAPARRFLRRILGDGLVCVEGAQHRMQRKTVGPAFQPKHIKELIPLFWGKSVELADFVAEKLDSRVGGKASGVVEINNIASRTTLDIIGVAGCGQNFNSLRNTENEFAKTYESIMDPDKGNLLLYVLLNLLFPQTLIRMLPWGANTRVANAARTLRLICKRIITEKKTLLEKEAEEGRQVDILSVLLKSGNFTDDELVDQMLTFFAAGHETTSNALTWTLYLLSSHPEAQTRLRKEIQSFISRGTEVNASLIDEMPYLHAVCLESLRFFPTVPMTVRNAVNETRILDTVVPKGTQVIICPWAINRSTKLWGEDADKFNPDRWLGSDKQPTLGSASSPYSLLTFLHGPRQCIGNGFAKNELKCLVAALIGRFTVEMADSNEVVEATGAVTIKPKHGLRLRMTEV